MIRFIKENKFISACLGVVLFFLFMVFLKAYTTFPARCAYGAEYDLCAKYTERIEVQDFCRDNGRVKVTLLSKSNPDVPFTAYVTKNREVSDDYVACLIQHQAEERICESLPIGSEVHVAFDHQKMYSNNNKLKLDDYLTSGNAMDFDITVTNAGDTVFEDIQPELENMHGTITINGSGPQSF